MKDSKANLSPLQYAEETSKPGYNLEKNKKGEVIQKRPFMSEPFSKAFSAAKKVIIIIAIILAK